MGLLPCSWNRDGLLACGLIVATLIAYQRVWHAGFIWDDDAHVIPPGLRLLHGLGRIWMQIGATQQYYPLVYSVFWAEHKLWGDLPLGYHLVNVGLHICSALLLVKILRQLGIPGAWLAAALFALHPVEVESVAWVSELKNTLSGLFYLGAALVYLQFDQDRNGRNYALALGLFLLGLMSKTVIASLPGALLVIFWWKRGRLSLKRDVAPLIPFFIAGIGAGLLTAWVEREILHAQGGEYNYSVIERFLIAGRAFWFYLGKLIWPVDLAFFYPAWHVSQTVSWQYLFPAAALLLLGGLVWRHWRGPLAALLFFAGTLFPALGFFNVYPFRYSLVADHFQYLASLGPFVLVASAITAVAKLLHKSKLLLASIRAMLLLFLGVLTWQQCGMYANNDSLWEQTYRLNSESWMAHNYFGIKNLQQGQFDQAMDQFHKALEIKPNYVDAADNLGLALLQKGRPDEAIIQFHKALEISPGDAEVCNNLAAALLQVGNTNEAISYCQLALRGKPDYADAQFNWGIALFGEGNVDDALGHFQKALEINPEYAQAHAHAGMILSQKGRADEALAHFQKALEIKPDNADAHFYLGNLLRQKGRQDEAMMHFRKALEINPSYADAHLNLGNMLLQTGNVDEAIAHFQQALRLNPEYANAENNLGNAFLKKGSFAEAIMHYRSALQIQPDDPSAQNNLAWLLATCPEASLRDGGKAVELAQEASALTSGQNALVLHTLGAAWAEAGRYPEAVETARRALVLAQAQSNSGLVRQLQIELKLYQADSPFHISAKTK